MAEYFDRGPRCGGDGRGGSCPFLPAPWWGRPVGAFSGALADFSLLHRAEHRRLLRLQADGHEVAVHLASRSFQYRESVDSFGVVAPGARLYFHRPEYLRDVLLRQDDNYHLLVLADICPGRHAGCL